MRESANSTERCSSNNHVDRIKNANDVPEDNMYFDNFVNKNPQLSPQKKRGLSLTLGTPVVLGLGHQFQIMDRCVAIKILKNLGVFFSRLIILWSSFGQGTFYMGSSNPELSSRSWGKSEKLDSGDMISGMTLLDCHVSYIYYHLLVYFTHRCFPYSWLHLKHL